MSYIRFSLFAPNPLGTFRHRQIPVDLLLESGLKKELVCRLLHRRERGRFREPTELKLQIPLTDAGQRESVTPGRQPRASALSFSDPAYENSRRFVG